MARDLEWCSALKLGQYVLRDAHVRNWSLQENYTDITTVSMGEGVFLYFHVRDCIFVICSRICSQALCLEAAHKHSESKPDSPNVLTCLLDRNRLVCIESWMCLGLPKKSKSTTSTSLQCSYYFLEPTNACKTHTHTKRIRVVISLLIANVTFWACEHNRTALARMLFEQAIPAVSECMRPGQTSDFGKYVLL